MGKSSWIGASVGIQEGFFLARDPADSSKQLKIEAEMAARVASRAADIVTERMQSEEVQKIVEQRLREERERLEQKVSPSRSAINLLSALNFLRYDIQV